MIVAPALLLALMTIVQFGLVFHARNVAENAAQAGAAVARRYDGDEDQARRQAQSYLSEVAGTTLVGTTVNVQRTPTDVQVTVRGVVASLIPGVHLSIDESAAGPVERYVPAPPETPR